MLVYLNDVDEGGCTSFSELGVHASPKRGSALLFFPSTAPRGEPDSRTIHAADPAVSEKWVAQMWIAWGMPRGDSNAEKLLAGGRSRKKARAPAAGGFGKRK